jgi:hypothetical protein
MSSGKDKKVVLTVNQKQTIALLLEALKLEHGKGCGHAYFSRQSRGNLRAVLSELAREDAGFDKKWRALLEQCWSPEESATAPKSVDSNPDASGRSHA